MDLFYGNPWQLLNLWLFSSFLCTSRDVLVQQHEPEPVHTDGHEADASAALADKTGMMDSTSRGNVGIDSSHQQDDKTHNELIDLEDSGDDLGTVVPRNMASRRYLKMVIDAEDDE